MENVATNASPDAVSGLAHEPVWKDASKGSVNASADDDINVAEQPTRAAKKTAAKKTAAKSDD